MNQTQAKPVQDTFRDMAGLVDDMSHMRDLIRPLSGGILRRWVLWGNARNVRARQVSRYFKQIESNIISSFSHSYY